MCHVAESFLTNQKAYLLYLINHNDVQIFLLFMVYLLSTTNKSILLYVSYNTLYFWLPLVL